MFTDLIIILCISVSLREFRLLLVYPQRQISGTSTFEREVGKNPWQVLAITLLLLCLNSQHNTKQFHKTVWREDVQGMVIRVAFASCVAA